MNDYILFTAGVVSAGIGGELFVRGAVGIAHALRISPGIIGATIAAFATSSPELSVAISASIAGNPQIALGDALGANVVNVALILGIALTMSGIQSPRDMVKRDLPVVWLVPVITAVLFIDGVLSRIDGVIMAVGFFAWLIATILEARRQRNAAEEVLIAKGQRGWHVILISGAGIVFLTLAGSLIVAGAKGIAISFGVGEFIIGAIIVAIGTTVPELATTVIAKFRGHEEVGLGTILGSNVFNGLLVVPVAALISPIQVGWRELAVTLTCGFLAVLLALPTKQGFIERRRGVLLLLLYAIYLAVLLQNAIQ